jgi:hypothetical protein
MNWWSGQMSSKRLLDTASSKHLGHDRNNSIALSAVKAPSLHVNHAFIILRSAEEVVEPINNNNNAWQESFETLKKPRDYILYAPHQQNCIIVQLLAGLQALTIIPAAGPTRPGS